MLFAFLGAYYFGGFFCGVSLGILYAVYLVRHRRCSPWSFSLGIGWLLVVLGILSFMHSQTTRPKTHIWMNGWGGFQEIGLGFWWLTLFIYLAARRKHRAASNQVQNLEQPSGGVWPPPPNDKL